MQTECHDVCLWECCVVTSGVAHRFPTVSTKPLIRHLAFSLALHYSLCELPQPLSVIEEGGKHECFCVLVDIMFCLCVCVCVCLCVFGMALSLLCSSVRVCTYVYGYRDRLNQVRLDSCITSGINAIHAHEKSTVRRELR